VGTLEEKENTYSGDDVIRNSEKNEIIIISSPEKDELLEKSRRLTSEILEKVKYGNYSKKYNNSIKYSTNSITN
jgi:hypothetical protein